MRCEPKKVDETYVGPKMYTIELDEYELGALANWMGYALHKHPNGKAMDMWFTIKAQSMWATTPIHWFRTGP